MFLGLEQENMPASLSVFWGGSFFSSFFFSNFGKKFGVDHDTFDSLDAVVREVLN